MENLLITNLWIIVDEETLNTMKIPNGLETAKFATKEEANMAAAEILNVWVAVSIHFNHKFLQHKV